VSIKGGKKLYAPVAAKSYKRPCLLLGVTVRWSTVRAPD